MIYRNARNCVLLEKSHTNDISPSPDIKIHCTRGVPRVLQYINRSSGELERFTWLINKDLSIQPINFYINEAKLPPSTVSQDTLLTCIKASQKLSQKLEYVRVDFMCNNNKVVFSEFTFVPAGACMPLKSRVVDEQFFQFLFG